MKLKHFSDAELRCPDTLEVRLAPGFAEALEGLRTTLGQPMIINSCCRSKRYNDRLGGHPRSLHVYDEPYHNTGGCCAVDIHIPDNQYRAEIMKIALNNDWSIGVAANFLHLDQRTLCAGLTQVVYHYKR